MVAPCQGVCAAAAAQCLHTADQQILSYVLHLPCRDGCSHTRAPQATPLTLLLGAPAAVLRVLCTSMTSAAVWVRQYSWGF
jgi:hypothetical protein